LVEHHINGRDIPNAEAAWNRCWLSPNAHDLVHKGDIVIEGWVMTTNGWELVWHYKGDGSITGRESTPPIYNGE